MILKIMMFFMFVYTMVSIIYTSIVYLMKIMNKYKQSIQKIRANNKKHITRNWVIRPILRKSVFKKIFLIKSKEHIDLIILGFSISFILLIGDTQIESRIPYFIKFCFAGLFLYGFARFICASPSGTFLVVQELGMKWLVLLIFILELIVAYFSSSMNVSMMIFTIIFSVFFLLILTKSTIKKVTNIWFQVFNLFLGYLMIWLLVGFVFGTFYLINNSIFNIFTYVEYNLLMNIAELNFTSLSFLIYKGLIYFYTFPTEISIDQPIKLILFFEYILGFLFNVVLIGLSISYITPIHSKITKGQ